VRTATLTVILLLSGAAAATAQPPGLPPGGPGSPVPPGPALVGVPSAGFTVSGLPVAPKDASRATITQLTAGASCYGQPDGFTVVEVDPDSLAAIKAEQALQQSGLVDPASRVGSSYVAPSTFVNGNWSSNGTTANVTLSVVDKAGKEIMRETATGPEASLLDLNAQAAKRLGARLCCQDKPAAALKPAATIDIDANYDIANAGCPLNRQTVTGRLQLSLSGGRYSGGGTSELKSDSECAGGVFMHMRCTVTERVTGAPRRAIPDCDTGSLNVDVSADMSCVTTDNLGTHPFQMTSPYSYALKLQDGYVLSYSLAPGLSGYYKLTLHLK